MSVHVHASKVHMDCGGTGNSGYDSQQNLQKVAVSLCLCIVRERGRAGSNVG